MNFPGTRRAAASGPLLILACSAALAGAEPLYVKNLSPVAGLLGLPAQRNASAQAEHSLGLALHSSLASHYVSDRTSAEGLNLDGETLRFALEARYGFAPDWDIHLEVPWLQHSGGELDNLIEGWHSFWGFPDGGRPDVPRDLMDYRYGGPDARFGLTEDAAGPGDVAVSVNHVFFRDGASAASVVLGYKFATGEERELLGSGGDDVFLALRFSGDHLSNLPLRWHGQLGYLRAGDAGLFEGAQERDIGFAGLTVNWMLSDSVSLIGQVDAHSAPVDSDLAALGETAVLLCVGARWQFARAWSAELSVVEDVQVDTGPDVTFQLSLRWRPSVEGR